jgi:hypothetical protein
MPDLSFQKHHNPVTLAPDLAFDGFFIPGHMPSSAVSTLRISQNGLSLIVFAGPRKHLDDHQTGQTDEIRELQTGNHPLKVNSSSRNSS